MLDQQIDAGQARTQFDVLVRTYEHIGLQIDYIEQDPKLPDMVFTANAGLIHDRTFIPSNFRYPERAPEAQLFADHFRAGGFRIESLAPEYLFEGAGDAI
ncbi:MAG: hypothetical protein KJO75_02895 [Dactylosporangium sp.]|nr:hypothetical protein [Dactylosporangium sp.]